MDRARSEEAGFAGGRAEAGGRSIGSSLRWLQASPARAAWVCAALALALSLPRIGDLDGLGHPDEAFYLSIVTDMADTGHLMPTHGGGYVYQKPPLVFWAARLSMALFGRNATAARLPGALAAAGACGAGALFAAEVAGEEAALLAGLLLLGCLGVSRFGRELMIDLPLAAVQTAAFLMFARALRGVPRALLWAGFFTSVSLAIKGPVGPAVIVVAAVGALVALRRLELLRRGELWLGLALGLPICLPWYVWAAATHFHDFWAIHILDQHFSRFDAPHGQNRWNLLLGAALYALPFTPLAADGLWRALADPERRRRVAVALAWIGGFALIFGLPKEHGLHYPVLILPALAALAADSALRPGAATLWLRRLTALLLALAGVAVPAASRFERIPTAAAFAAGATLLVAAWLWARRDALSAGLGSFSVAVGTALAIGWIGPALAGPLVPPEAAAAGAGHSIAVVGEHPGPYALAASWDHAYEAWGAGDLGRAIDRGDLVLFRDHMLDGTTAPFRARLVPLARWRRLRPYLQASEIWQAWRAGNLDRLREDNGLYRPGP
jgi:4-amino-4-deoxy-L-arabinose transferase-like glycosyltransferase